MEIKCKFALRLKDFVKQHTDGGNLFPKFIVFEDRKRSLLADHKQYNVL